MTELRAAPSPGRLWKHKSAASSYAGRSAAWPGLTLVVLVASCTGAGRVSGNSADADPKEDQAGGGGLGGGGPGGGGGSPEGPGKDAGVCDPASDAALPAARACSCVPGATRWCPAHLERPWGWGKQICQADGSWGAPCKEAGGPPSGCEMYRDYWEECLLDRGYCSVMSIYGARSCESMGECASALTCDKPAPSPPPPHPECTPGRACVPGKWVWCNLLGSHGKATCDSSGRWGECLPALPERPVGCPTTLHTENCCVAGGGCCSISVRSNPPGSRRLEAVGACEGIACRTVQQWPCRASPCE